MTYGTRDVRVEEVADATPGEHEVEVEIAWGVMCGFGPEPHPYCVGTQAIDATSMMAELESIGVKLGRDASGRDLADRGLAHVETVVGGAG